MTKEKTHNAIPRPPVVAIMGHIDHGKSTLLDYIRKTKITEHEAGGITQHIAAYEVIHLNDEGKERKITFLDTPGHEAFAAMRSRGAHASDIVILVIAADDGVKPQTLEAHKAILESNTPHIVAITKIDKPGADPDRVKYSLAEHGIFIEGLGGSVPVVTLSSKTGEGVKELLSMILLVADLEELTGNPEKPAEGVVIETNCDPKKGIAATLIIKDGTLAQGMAVVSQHAVAPVRVMEDFLGKKITSATFSNPIQLTGFNMSPEVGNMFYSFQNKKEAERYAAEHKDTLLTQQKTETPSEGDTVAVPLILKTDTRGSIEAIKHQIQKITLEKVTFSILAEGVGTITENDIKHAGADSTAVVIGFNVKIDASARAAAERQRIQIETFDIIYRLTEFLEKLASERTPRHEVEETLGSAKILKCFSKAKDQQVLGAKLISGTIEVNAPIKILRRAIEIGRGSVTELQEQKARATSVHESGTEFGMKIHAKIEIATGDVIEAVRTVVK